MSRDAILNRVRSALGRQPGELPPALLEPLLPEAPAQDHASIFLSAVARVGGVPYRAISPADARDYAASKINGKKAIASAASCLTEYGIADLADASVQCSDAEVGITSADYALADTGTLVLFSSAEEARMISLLPPVHIAVVPSERILSGLEELFTRERFPAERSSSMVLITGTSRTGDIEQILVRGVHGPGEVHVIVV